MACKNGAQSRSGGKIVEKFDSSQIHETQTQGTQTQGEDKIEALAEIICRGGDESPLALLILMGVFEISGQPQALANAVKHFAFTRCGELNLYGIVDALHCLNLSCLGPVVSGRMFYSGS